jgi:formylglycine-generating enzyme required for sulfatase activity
MLHQPGDLVLAKYRVERFIGKGASAEVYLATHLELKAPRALKILSRDLPGVGTTAFGDYRQRFQLEAQLGARIDHPNVIRVYDFHQEEDSLILVMEFATGGSLADRIAKARETGQPVPEDEAVRLAGEVAQGLAALHALDVVHRDLKPSNILLDGQGRAKVADLGLAQIPGGPSQRSVLSQPMAHPGTPGYMSPEQVVTNDCLSPASDVYALGCVLFELLTGRMFRMVQPGTRLRSLRPDVPEWLDDLVARMVELDPGERPWDGAKVTLALSEVERREAAARLLAEEERQQAAARAAAEEERRLAEQERARQEAARLERARLVAVERKSLWLKRAGAAAGLVALVYFATRLVPLGPSPTPVPAPSSIAAASRTATPVSAAATSSPAPSPTLIATPSPASVTSTATPGATSTAMPTPTLRPTNTAIAAVTSTPKPVGDPNVLALAPGVIIDLVRVSAGPFLMGSAASDSEADSDEKPQHTVTLGEYYIGKYEVTQAQWAAFVKATGYASSTKLPVGKEGHPVTQVSWDDAVAFTKWASQASGREVRLPTEAEWEKAARGTDGRVYPWGSEAPDGTRCNFNGNVGDTTPVGKYSSRGDSPYGAVDMCGNVWEWTSSLYKGYPYSATDGREDAASREPRVLRGGSFVNYARNVRSANRYNINPNYRYDDSGFRVVASPIPL